MFKRILVPTDGSTLSARAVRLAIRLARGERARIFALHVIEPFTPPPFTDVVVTYPEMYSPEQYRKSTEARARKLLARVEAAAKKERVACESVVVIAAPVWRAIVKAARAKRCDLVVMASHGRRGIAAVVIGSETSRVLTHSKIPVLVSR
jgi:nucleotide-binding universal stress UspA family protein